jgi:hypothetical protein
LHNKIPNKGLEKELKELKPHAKFQNPTLTPSWRKVTAGEERRERKKQR